MVAEALGMTEEGAVLWIGGNVDLGRGFGEGHPLFLLMGSRPRVSIANHSASVKPIRSVT